MAWSSDPERCRACGGLIEEPLARMGSLRCQECRSNDRPLVTALVLSEREKSREHAAEKKP